MGTNDAGLPAPDLRDWLRQRETLVQRFGLKALEIVGAEGWRTDIIAETVSRLMARIPEQRAAATARENACFAAMTPEERAAESKRNSHDKKARWASKTPRGESRLDYGIASRKAGERDLSPHPGKQAEDVGQEKEPSSGPLPPTTVSRRRCSPRGANG